ncbi:hypothetical protein PGB90_000356 [Kerria lacca]
MMRGRGGRPMNRTQLRTPFKTVKSHVAKPPFDLIMCENSFPRVNTVNDENFQAALIKRVNDLSPTEIELNNLNTLVVEVQKVFDSLIVSPNNFSGCQIEESRAVGSFKKGTILRGHKTADVVVVLQTLPFQKSIEVLAVRVLDDLKKLQSLPQVEKYFYELNENGFVIKGALGSVRIRIATVPSNYSKLDPNVHLPLKTLENHAAAVKHVRWFEENAQNETIKNTVRLLRDLKLRFEGLGVLSPWMIDLLSFHVIMNNPKKEILTESAAYRRALQLLAAGLFLIGSAGIADPCDNNKWLHNAMPYEQQDLLCLTAQNLIRVLAHGGYIPLLSGKPNIATSATMWQGVVVNSSEKAYEKPIEKESTVEEMEVSAGEI